MASSLSNLANNFSEGIHRIKCKCGHDDKKCDTCGIKYKYCQYRQVIIKYKYYRQYTNFKDD